MSLFVIVQFLLSPKASVTLPFASQLPPIVAVYPGKLFSDTMCIPTVVVAATPDVVVALSMKSAKFDVVAVPPLSLTIIFVTVNFGVQSLFQTMTYLLLVSQVNAGEVELSVATTAAASVPPVV